MPQSRKTFLVSFGGSGVALMGRARLDRRSGVAPENIAAAGRGATRRCATESAQVLGVVAVHATFAEVLGLGFVLRRYWMEVSFFFIPCARKNKLTTLAPHHVTYTWPCP